ncbi:hypothetical protein [Shimia sp. MMG029]|uniref:hypothetical protein n=1 Tax=Shimia sp. MMG029 TaxID=3021978 RepID=UPI0022FE3DF5|nr:hypothetical protein [Shimia sp. MMG029]MDA5558151.1 hypothetical protein [Shimia sp. MMG029]
MVQKDFVSLGWPCQPIFKITSQTGQTLQFQTIDMDLQGYIVSKRVQDSLVAEHPFVTEARANVHKDQFVSRATVVFETNFLQSKPAEKPRVFIGAQPRAGASKLMHLDKLASLLRRRRENLPECLQPAEAVWKLFWFRGFCGFLRGSLGNSVSRPFWGPLRRREGGN